MPHPLKLISPPPLNLRQRVFKMRGKYSQQGRQKMRRRHQSHSASNAPSHRQDLKKSLCIACVWRFKFPACMENETCCCVIQEVKRPSQEAESSSEEEAEDKEEKTTVRHKEPPKVAKKGELDRLGLDHNVTNLPGMMPPSLLSVWGGGDCVTAGSVDVKVVVNCSMLTTFVSIQFWLLPSRAVTQCGSKLARGSKTPVGHPALCK